MPRCAWLLIGALTLLLHQTVGLAAVLELTAALTVWAVSTPAVLVASPAHLKRLPPALPWGLAAARLSGLFSSGGPLPDAALADCRSLLLQAPIEVYGSTETGGIAWRRRDEFGSSA